MLDVLLDVVALALLGGGLTLVTIGLYGMLRLDDILHQLHAAALITGPGVVLILLAAIGSRNAVGPRDRAGGAAARRGRGLSAGLAPGQRAAPR